MSEVGQIFGEGSGPATALLRSPTVIIASVALWGMNVYFFRVFKIDYSHVLLLDIRKEEEEERQKKEGGRALPISRRSRSISTSSLGVNENGNNEIVRSNASSPETIEMKSLMINKHGDDNPSGKLDESDSGFVAVSLEADKEAANVTLPKQPTTSPSKDMVVYKDDVFTETNFIVLALVLMVTLHFTSYLWIQVFNGSTVGAIFFFYGLVIVGVVMPLKSTAWMRTACKTVFHRGKELLNPRCSCFGASPRPVPFIDVFFADAMCSLSKVFFDLGMLWHLAAHYPHPVPSSAQSIIIPSCFASLPYIIRARQCLIMYNVGRLKQDPKRYHHILNAIKYSSSLFPLIVSAFQKTSTGEAYQSQLEMLLIILLIINATYCLLWDIIMDWGMMDDPKVIVEQTVGQCAGGYGLVPNPANKSTSSHGNGQQSPQTKCIAGMLRPRLRFGAPLSLVILVIDIILRYSWTLRFYETRLFASNDAYILCAEFLEVFRRSVWNLLRVEWEQIKQLKAKKGLEIKAIHGGNALHDEEYSPTMGAGVIAMTPMVRSTSTQEPRRGLSMPTVAISRSSSSRERKTVVSKE